MPTDRDLILSLRKSDFVVTPFKSSGPGGQHRNKTATAIRIEHPASGARAEATESRSQDQNKKAAWKRLRETETFQAWLKRAIAEASLTNQQKRALEEATLRRVEAQMQPKLILIEVKDDNGNWVPMPDIATEDCGVCNGTGLTYDRTECRMVPCGGICCRLRT